MLRSFKSYRISAVFFGCRIWKRSHFTTSKIILKYSFWKHWKWKDRKDICRIRSSIFEFYFTWILVYEYKYINTSFTSFCNVINPLSWSLLILCFLALVLNIQNPEWGTINELEFNKEFNITFSLKSVMKGVTLIRALNLWVHFIFELLSIFMLMINIVKMKLINATENSPLNIFFLL